MQRIFIAAAALAALIPFTQAQSSGARNQAMGGAGVASSNPQVSPFINPALMHHNVKEQGLSLMLPFIGVLASDPDELVDKVDDLQDSLDRLQERIDAADVPGADALRPVVASQLQALSGTALDTQVGAGLSFLYPTTDFTVGVSARTYIDARILPIIDPADIATITGSNNSADFDNLQSEAVVGAAAITEFGVSVATGIQFLGRDVTIGVTPKFQSVETYNYSASVSNFDEDDAEDDFDNDEFRDKESAFNVDVGAAIDLNENVTVGLSVTNLISDSFETVVTNGRQFDYEVEARPTVGAAFRGAGFTVTGDLDLLPTARFEGVDDSQYLRVGGEYDLAGWAQLRVGAAIDLESTQEDIFSAGVGLSPFETVRIDLVGQYGDNAVGAGLQIALTF